MRPGPGVVVIIPNDLRQFELDQTGQVGIGAGIDAVKRRQSGL